MSLKNILKASFIFTVIGVCALQNTSFAGDFEGRVLELEQKVELLQVKVNKLDAEHSGSGIWVCSAACVMRNGADSLVTSSPDVMVAFRSLYDQCQDKSSYGVLKSGAGFSNIQNSCMKQ